MTWFRVDDKFAFHRKAVQAGNTAIGVWVRLGAWSSDQMTDGWLPSEVAIVIQGGDVGALDRLCEVELLERDGKNYKLHDFLDWNPSAKHVKRQRKELSETRSKAGGKGAAARWQKHGPSPDPDPDPDPDPREEKRDPPLSPKGGGAPGFKLEPPEPKRSKGDRKKPAHALPVDWQPNAHAFEVGRTCGLDGDRVRFEVDRFRDHAKTTDRRCVEWDAAFGNWLRGAKPGPAPATFRPAEPPRPAPKPPPRIPLPDVPWVDGKPQFSRDRPKPPREPDPAMAPETDEERAEREELNRLKVERVARERAEREAAEAAAARAS